MIDLKIGVEIKLTGLLCYVPGVRWILPRIVAGRVRSGMQRRLAVDLQEAQVAAQGQVDAAHASMTDDGRLHLSYRVLVVLTDHYQAAYANTAGLVQLGVVVAKPFSDLPLFQESVEVSVRRQIIGEIKTQLPADIIAGMSSICLRAREVCVRIS
jgi:hypothetical protein